MFVRTFVFFVLDKWLKVLDTMDMSRTTVRIMASMGNRLKTLLRLETRAGGFDEEVAKADRQYERTLKYLECEIEQLAVKAGEP